MTLIGIAYHEQKRYALGHIADWVRDARPDAEVVMRWHTGIFGQPDAVKTQREFFRNLAMEKGYSHLMFVGADTIPPVDALPRLLAHNLPAVGGLYNHREGGEPIAWPKTALTGGLVQVSGMGMDCVLFSREAFSQVSFFDWPQPDDDYPYYDRLKKLGFKIMLDMDVVCKHYQTETDYK